MCYAMAGTVTEFSRLVTYSHGWCLSTRPAPPSFVWGHHDNQGVPSRRDVTVPRVSMKTDVTESAVAGGVRGAEAVTGAVSEHIVTKIPMIKANIASFFLALVKHDLVTGMVVMDQTLWAVHYMESFLHAYPREFITPATDTIHTGVDQPLRYGEVPPWTVATCDQR